MVKAALILAYLACDWRTVIARLDSLGLSPMLVLFLALYAIMAASLFLAAQIRQTWLRVALALLFATGSIYQQAFEWTTGGALTYEAFLNLYHSSSHAGEAFAQHGHVLLKVVPFAALLFLGIALPARNPRFPAKLAIAAPFLAIGLLAGLLYVRGGEGSRGLPAALPPVAFAGFLSAQEVFTDHGERKDVTLARIGNPMTQDIVLLVDESVSGNYLDINNSQGVRSGLLDPPDGVRLVNFGYAAAIHTCSANTNAVLRHGGTRKTYQQALESHPSIWACAREVGLRTVYIDAQLADGELQNLMTPEERAEIDDLVQLGDTPPLERDMEVARMLAERINNGRPEFIFVNKVGAHFPIQDKYPDEFMRYQPVMERGSTGLVSWTSDRTGFNGTPPEWVEYRNSYRNTLLWNVGEFFDRLLPSANLGNATIIYTSDHGQNLHERGDPGNNTHCGAQVSSQEEGLVPLVVIEGEAGTTLDWQQHLSETRNGLSHFRIFPTLLALMGYDREAARPFYGPALDESGPDDFSFNVVFHNYLGREPQFRTIDREEIVDPPMSDFTGK